MTRYCQIGVTNGSVTNGRVITVKEQLQDRPRIVTDPHEQITALIEARFEYALTPEEKVIAAQIHGEKDAMEKASEWGQF